MDWWPEAAWSARRNAGESASPRSAGPAPRGSEFLCFCFSNILKMFMDFKILIISNISQSFPYFQYFSGENPQRLLLVGGFAIQLKT